jgi:hypothetical protein
MVKNEVTDSIDILCFLEDMRVFMESTYELARKRVDLKETIAFDGWLVLLDQCLLEQQELVEP